MASPVKESLRYAFHRELLILYGVVILGYLMTALPRALLPPDFEWEIIGLPFTLIGITLIVVGVVGVLHRVNVDTA